MNKQIATNTAPKPFSNYSQAVEVPGGSRMLSVSGQVGVDTSGQLAATEKAQHEQTWQNITAIWPRPAWASRISSRSQHT